MDLRNAHIGIAVFAAILIVGTLLFRSEGDDAVQLVTLVALIAAFGVFHFLDERERRSHSQR